MLLFAGGATDGIVVALRTRDDVERAQRVVVHGGGIDADVIVVRADEHILIGALRVRAGQNGDDVSPRCRGDGPRVVPMARDWRARGGPDLLL